MSVMENAQQLVQSSGQLASDAIGATTAAAEAAGNVQQNLARVQEVCENSVQTAAALLGEGHNGLGPITGSAAAVTEAVIALQGQAQQLLADITGLDALILAHGGVIQMQGELAMGGGA